ncbi:MAG TPA: hypothetical protein VF306_11265 [Pirellulales bacterium]
MQPVMMVALLLGSGQVSTESASGAPPASQVASSEGRTTATPVNAAGPLRRLISRRIRLMSEDREAKLRKRFPNVADADTANVLADPDLILYTDDEMPKVYQFWDGMFPGVHDVHYNISAHRGERFGNGNREFPWSAPAGTHRSPNVETLRFMLLPVDSQGKRRPIVWFKKRHWGDRQPGYGWTYPVGTVFGEVLAQLGPDGKAYTFELRTRRRSHGHWEVDVFRPFPTAASLSRRVKELRPNWQDQPELVRLVKHLDEPHPLPLQTLADNQPEEQVFNETMGVDFLPAVSDHGLIGELLTSTVFRSSRSDTWRSGPRGEITFAPTTKASFHIVPANYDAGFVAIDNQSCMRCHSSCNRPVDDFNSSRQWYGRIRGSDGIFSFHPFAPESVSYNGFRGSARFRYEFEQAGLFEPFDPKRHPNSVYNELDGERRY